MMDLVWFASAFILMLVFTAALVGFVAVAGEWSPAFAAWPLWARVMLAACLLAVCVLVVLACIALDPGTVTECCVETP